MIKVFSPSCEMPITSERQYMVSTTLAAVHLRIFLCRPSLPLPSPQGVLCSLFTLSFFSSESWDCRHCIPMFLFYFVISICSISLAVAWRCHAYPPFPSTVCQSTQPKQIQGSIFLLTFVIYAFMTWPWWRDDMSRSKRWVSRASTMRNKGRTRLPAFAFSGLLGPCSMADL
jgi:hypothetical protein